MSLNGFSLYHGQIEFVLYLNSVSFGLGSIQGIYYTLSTVSYANKPNIVNKTTNESYLNITLLPQPPDPAENIL